ncbi:hypothetical protein SMICM17S_07950 [Streptomyces microflavus]
MSPWAPLYSPAWNHGKEFSRWCMPTGISARLATPKMPAPTAPEPTSRTSPKLCRPAPRTGQIRPKTIPMARPAKAERIGTRRRPLKKPAQSGSFVR